MATKDNPGAFDCYANAKPDEPMFVLLARDELAPHLTRLWALIRSTNANSAGDTQIQIEIEAALAIARQKGTMSVEKYNEAMTCARHMEIWNEQEKAEAARVAAFKFKVIDVDNFDRDYQTEYLVCGNYSKEECEHIAAIANEHMNGPNASRFFRVVREDRKLYVFDGY